MYSNITLLCKLDTARMNHKYRLINQSGKSQRMTMTLPIRVLVSFVGAKVRQYTKLTQLCHCVKWWIAIRRISMPNFKIVP
jgi:hypothetical protein